MAGPNWAIIKVITEGIQAKTAKSEPFGYIDRFIRQNPETRRNTGMVN